MRLVSILLRRIVFPSESSVMGGSSLIALGYGPGNLFLQSLTSIPSFSEMMAPLNRSQKFRVAKKQTKPKQKSQKVKLLLLSVGMDGPVLSCCQHMRTTTWGDACPPGENQPDAFSNRELGSASAEWSWWAHDPWPVVISKGVWAQRAALRTLEWHWPRTFLSFSLSLINSEMHQRPKFIDEEVFSTDFLVCMFYAAIWSRKQPECDKVSK